MSFVTQQMLLISNNEEDCIFTVTIDAELDRNFKISYKGSMLVDYGDGQTKNIKSETKVSTETHTYAPWG